jgi:hypothetical protein
MPIRGGALLNRKAPLATAELFLVGPRALMGVCRTSGQLRPCNCPRRPCPHRVVDAAGDVWLP